MKQLTLRTMNPAGFVSIAVSVMSLAIAAIPARADVVFSNFGPSACAGDPACIADNGINQNFDGVAGQTQTFDPGDIEMIASSFTSGGNFTLDSVSLPLQEISGTANVYLTANNGGVPGAVLEGWTGVTGETFAAPQTNALTLASVLNPTLSSGAEYWLVVGPATSASELAWNYAFFGPAASALNTQANGTPNGGIPTLAGPWSFDGGGPQNAFQINGTPINVVSSTPEPATLPILGAALLGIVVMARRIRPVQKER